MVRRDDEDWRVLAKATLAKPVPPAYPGGPSHEAGDRLTVGTWTTGPEGERIRFTAPSLVALLMDLAIRGMRRAKTLRRTLAYENVPSPEGIAKCVAEPNIPHLFDMFQACVTTVTSAFGALEAFSNYFIAAKVTEPYSLIRRHGLQELQPDELPRVTSLEEKLATILPDVLSVESPKGKKVWEQFKALKSARDATVHLKNSDVYYGGKFSDGGTPLFSVFFQESVLEFPAYALNMIEHFGPPAEGSQWFKHARRKLEEI